MLSLLFVVLSLESILGFKYVKEPMSWYDAKMYCKTKFGTDLATVKNGRTRRMALGQIRKRDYPPDAVWIGMEHEEPNPSGNYPCHFTYPDHPKYPGVCPLYPDDYKCVRFWCNEKPKLVNRGGSECVTYNWKSRGRHGGVDNAIKCGEKLPFLCEKPDEICVKEDSICLRLGPRFCICLLEQFCDPNPFEGCMCDIDASGESKCVDHFVSCRGRPRCRLANKNADCPAGTACVQNTCCARIGRAVCMPLCGEDAPRKRRNLLSLDDMESGPLCEGAIYEEDCPDLPEDDDDE